MYRKNKRKLKIKYMTIGLLGIILVCISIIFIRDERKLNIIEKTIKDGFLFVGNIVLTPTNFIKEKFNEYKDKQNLYDKYVELERKIISYESLLAEKEELKKEIKELKQILQINNLLSEKKAMNATVINRNLDYWHDTITIDKGSHDGVEEGMPVVIGTGVIGKIVSVSNFNSTVKLFTSETSSKISVKISNGEDYAYGLLSSYDKNKDLYIIEGVSHTINIINDSLVTTTGLGDIFPSGLVIGNVIGTNTDSYGLTRIIEVRPSTNFENFNIVTILKRNA